MIGFFRQHTLSLLLTFAAAVTFLWLLPFRKRLRMSWPAALALSLLHVLVGLLCVTFFAFLEGAESGARSLFGAVFFMPLAYGLGAKLLKRKAADVFDVFAVCMIFTLLCARIGCLFSGCCQGRMIPGLEPHRWPTRELELVFYAVFLALTVPGILKGKSGGRVYPTYMMAYGLTRGILECFREASTDSVFHLAHVWALLSLILGFVILTEIDRHQRLSHGKRETR
ncbi:MAG: prolipoprotein diacylglyceryl transferase [Oscillospiraceae bacterium]|nr:prolipoprotein diacylglyceryl transferase [Oscillospiraceae bacterium]